MLDKLLHKHLDQMDELEARVQEEIDVILASIDRKQILDNPREALYTVVEAVKSILEEKYIPLAAKDGFDLIKKVVNKDVIIDDSTNPNQNKELMS